ncbi:MAG: peptidoglycan DD-metalloendopeptidase family protein [Proteobacteria bacterium]|nr:peptidoglycan DD-metalloendopeptidase family protein [Pseudomonadota bacterium]
MAQKTNVSLENSTKPTRLFALLAFGVAFALPFILVKTFSHHPKAVYQPEQSETNIISASNDITAVITPVKTESVKVPTKPLPIVKLATTTENKDKTNDDLKNTPKTVAEKETTNETKAKEVLKPKLPPIPTPIVVKSKTAIDKKSNQASLGKDWQLVKIRRGDTMAVIFKRLGLSAQTLHNIMRDKTHAKILTRLKLDEQIQFLIKNKTLEKMVIPYSSIQTLEIYRDGARYKSKTNSQKTDSHNRFVSATVRGSLLNTAHRHNIHPKLIQQMTEILSSDINFAKEVRGGDQFSMIYNALYIGNKQVGTGDIIAVSYRKGSNTFQAVRHTNRQGRTDYYNPQGSSLKKAFNRYPIRFSHISSTFSLSRYHPILHYRRPHKGVDLAAPIGTPILATGDGRIEIIGRQSGYGNMIKIKHNNNFSSIYGHMLRFQKGISKGTYVKRGQVIGYVGQTGLASGPHCHYEFHVNRQPRNPTTVSLPRGDAVPSRELARFKANSHTLLAQLKLFENGRLPNANRIG